jgi:outer membrane protein assembly factor BamB
MTDDTVFSPEPVSPEPGATPAQITRRTALLASLLALPGCSFFDRLFGDTKKPLPGKREDVLPVNEGLQAPHGMHPSVTLPAPVSTDWPMQGGVPSHLNGNAALPSSLHQAWSATIGDGSAYRRQVTSTPIVAGDTIFTMDSNATVSAFRASDGKRLWQTKTKPKKSRSTNIGGGIGYANGTVYASTGFSEVLALNAETGAINWRRGLDSPVRSAPTIVDGRIFVSTIDQILFGLSAKDGSRIWSFDASPTDTTLLGQPAPAYSSGIVITGFGSGDLVAIRGDSGAVSWSDSIAATSGQVGVAEISAITALPIVIGELVCAIGTGGLMVAVDLRAGRRLWEREVSGILSPAAAGDFIFITTTDQQVAALVARTGEVAWLTQLPQYKRPKTQGGPLTWTGPVLAGGELIYASRTNSMILVDAITGAITRTMKLPDAVTVPPIAANGTLYLITDDGALRAYR